MDKEAGNNLKAQQELALDKRAINYGTIFIVEICRIHTIFIFQHLKVSILVSWSQSTYMVS